MYNDYYLLKRVKEEEGAVAYASVQDSFTYKGEVIKTPYSNDDVTGTEFYGAKAPQVGDKVLFLKGAGEDIEYNGEQMKVVKFEDLIMSL